MQAHDAIPVRAHGRLDDALDGHLVLAAVRDRCQTVEMAVRQHDDPTHREAAVVELQYGRNVQHVVAVCEIYGVRSAITRHGDRQRYLREADHP